MIKMLSNDIWYGDKPSVSESLGKVKSIINVAHSLRRPYWQDLGKLDWSVWYFCLASPDRDELDFDYMQAFHNTVKSIKLANKFPLLCHCRAGGHRGPTAAMFAYWILNGRKPRALEYASAKIGIKEGNPNRVYHRCVLEYCRKYSV